MTLPTTNYRIQYSGNDVTTAFSFPYLFFKNTDLVVTITSSSGVDTVKTLTTHYTVSGAGSSSGGTVTMLTPPATGEKLTIQRIVALTQETDYVANDEFPASAHESALDKLTMIAQQVSATGGLVDRSLKYPATEAAGFVSELPIKSARASKYLAFDASGDPIASAGAPASSVVVSSYMETLLDDTTASAAQTTLGATTVGKALFTAADAAAGRTTLELGSNATTSTGLMPVGSILPYGGASAPSTWMLCYGQAVSRTTYSALYAVLGDVFGSGDGSTTFNLPDLRGRVALGKDNMGGTAANRVTNAVSGFDPTTLGAAGGSQSHTLITSEIPAHQHGMNSPTGAFVVSGTSGAGASINATGATYQTVANTDAAGGGGAHRNVQPSITINYIIYAGV